MKNKSQRSGSTNLDSQNTDYSERRNNIQNRANPSDNPNTGVDDDDDYNVEDIEDAYEYADDDLITDSELDDNDHEHRYSVPVAEENDDEYYYNENRPQDDRF